MSAGSPDAARITALARRLRCEPRVLLVAAARLCARPDAPLTAERLRRELDRAAAAPEQAQAAAALALLGAGAYALDDVGRALGMAWSPCVRLP